MLKNITIPSISMTIIVGIVSLMAAFFVFAGDVATMGKDELKAQLGSDDLIILDVRTGRDWSSSEFKVQGAQRASASDFNKWSANLPKDKTLVLYCAWTNEATSASLARKLMTKGYTDVYALKGGWREWFRAKYPVEPI